jgi:formylglycine-generating enzyme required for sulfatase activity
MMAKNPADRFRLPKEVASALVPFIKGTKETLAESAIPGPDGNSSGGTTPAARVVSGLPNQLPATIPWSGIVHGVRTRPGRQVDRRTSFAARRTLDGGKRSWLVALIGAAMLFGLAGLGGVLFRVKTPSGTVVIENVPPDAEVRVDGEQVTVSRKGDTLTVTSLPEGPHRLKVKHGGDEILSSDLTVAFGSDPLRLRVEPAASADKTQPKIPPVVTPPTLGDAPSKQSRAEVRDRPKSLDCTGEAGISAADVRLAQEAWARYLGRKVEETVEIADGVSMTFVLVPPGRFRMGSPKGEQGHDDKGREGQELGELLHTVVLTEPFDLGKYEVTQAQYRALVSRVKSEELKDPDPSKFKGAELPVEMVFWSDANAFGRELTKLRSDKHVYRLPTEAEWEYSCRGGRPSSQPFGIGDGHSLSSHLANFNGNHPYPYESTDNWRFLNRTRKVGSYAPNALGLYDMHGNVWEWCSDLYGPYPLGEVTNPTGPAEVPAEGPYHMRRGGGWVDASWSCRAAFRRRNPLGDRHDMLGFRLVRSVPLKVMQGGRASLSSDVTVAFGSDPLRLRVEPAASADKTQPKIPPAVTPPLAGGGPMKQGRAEVRDRPKSLDCTGEAGISAADVRLAQEAWARYLGRKVEETVEIANGVSMTFVLVPPGRFRMGSPKGEQDPEQEKTEELLHTVVLTEPFDLGRYEVTQAQFRALVSRLISKELKDRDPSQVKGADLPVENVSWYQAEAYGRELTKLRADKHTYRLPTEAEWEYSCRGGRPSSQPFGIGNGHSLSSLQANFDGTYPYGDADKGVYLRQICKVGAYTPNALGLFDMHGNAWEWCYDRFGPYSGEEVTNPTGHSEGPHRVFRGGGCRFEGRTCRAASRSSENPEAANYNIGFRLARRVPSGGK